MQSCDKDAVERTNSYPTPVIVGLCVNQFFGSGKCGAKSRSEEDFHHFFVLGNWYLVRVQMIRILSHTWSGRGRWAPTVHM
jgi:hypothetical protein